MSIQNQTGKRPTKWDRSGIVVEVRDFDKYIVKVDGSGRLTLRNRRFLKKLFDDVGMYGALPPKDDGAVEEAPSNVTPETQHINSPQPSSSTTNDEVSIPNLESPLHSVLPQCTIPTGTSQQPTVIGNRRSRRTVSPRLVYDATKGIYVPCDSGDNLDD